jgi:hypothetical protein
MYDCIKYKTGNIPNFVPVLVFNSARFEMNFINDILHNPPHLYIEFIIGNLNYFKIVTILIFNWLSLKFLDAINYACPQTLDNFVKMFGNVKDFQKGVFVVTDLIQLIMWKYLTRPNVSPKSIFTPPYVIQTLMIKTMKHTL